MYVQESERGRSAIRFRVHSSKNHNHRLNIIQKPLPTPTLLLETEAAESGAEGEVAFFRDSTTHHHTHTPPHQQQEKKEDKGASG
jgi:hypothetical protein